MKPTLGTCPACGGPIKCSFRSKLGLSEYYCNVCGIITPTIPRLRQSDEHIRTCFDTIATALFDSGRDTLKLDVVCSIVMKEARAIRITGVHIPMDKYIIDRETNTITRRVQSSEKSVQKVTKLQ